MVCSGLVMLKVPTGLEHETLSPQKLSFLDVYCMLSTPTCAPDVVCSADQFVSIKLGFLCTLGLFFPFSCEVCNTTADE